MSLLDLAAEDFDADVMQRGRSYFDQGAVRITHASDDRITARVRGHEHYHVKIRWDATGRFRFRCTCPYFQDTGPCKHIWATMLQAQEEQLLPAGADGDDAASAGEEDEQEYGPADGKSSRMLRQLEQIRKRKSAAPQSAPASKPPPWKRQIAELRERIEQRSTYGQRESAAAPAWPANRRLAYVLDVTATVYEQQALVIELCAQTLDKSGRWSSPKRFRFSQSQLASMPDETDALLVRMLAGLTREAFFYRSSYDHPVDARYVLMHRDYETVLARMCQTGRCFARGENNHPDVRPLEWDSGKPWEFWIEVRADPSGERYIVSGSLRRDGQILGIRQPSMLLMDGLMLHDSRLARFDDFGAFEIAEFLRSSEKPMSLAVQQGQEFVAELMSMSPLPRLDFPQELQVREISQTMRPRLTVQPPRSRYAGGDDRLVGTLGFEYGSQVIEEGADPPLFDAQARTLLRRDLAAEAAAAERLRSLGFKTQWSYDARRELRRLHPKKLGSVVSQLCAEGWHVEAQGKLYRQPGQFKIELSSGIDWFELQGGIDFGDGISAPLPKLLAALRRGEKMITLDDGTVGILPDQWLSRYGLLARIGSDEDEQGNIRFNRRQIGLLDALVASMPEARVDSVFEQARDELRRFEGVVPIDPPAGFVGTLRPYQRQGLGWLEFLNRFGFGGCLADDMGLGKTVQVLALLEARRQQRSAGHIGNPSLVVAPRSLIFNWIEEAKRFTPELRVLDHTGTARAKSAEHFADYDVILTTYGTLRLDAPFIKDFDFDYAILDEAQAIKNSSSESAKAARLVRADYRLALSGTPVQNHLGELWSLFEFLNPGMLGAASVFKATGAGSAAIDRDARELLSRALRPFILRRTKEQVATDLPEKTEQTIWCDLEPAQRKLYDELRDHYRASLLSRIESEGLNKAKIQVLEALLRLRQAACHPGLIDKAHVDHPSAKLDALLPQISEVIDEGHKVLVFSQFTSLLAIVRKQLDAQTMPYEYLDGKTRDRQARVERFQNDPQCKLFLISLKAGGLGLNLTAAEYVFLLDPWWNPAVESQAIDRAHRIGQTRHVFAYRFIARDTVEQKVLELQSRKKELADMIISADNSLISKLGREDLELLLS